MNCEKIVGVMKVVVIRKRGDDKVKAQELTINTWDEWSNYIVTQKHIQELFKIKMINL